MYVKPYGTRGAFKLRTGGGEQGECGRGVSPRPLSTRVVGTLSQRETAPGSAGIAWGSRLVSFIVGVFACEKVHSFREWPSGQKTSRRRRKLWPRSMKRWRRPKRYCCGSDGRC